MKEKKIKDEDYAYIAGFVDGDGSINAQIVRRDDYILRFQIRVTISCFQKIERMHWLRRLKKELGVGTIRKRNDGMAEFTIVGKQSVVPILQKLRKRLRIKRRQAVLVLLICRNLSKEQTKEQFLQTCQLVDQVAACNDSKKRIITAETVRKTFVEMEQLERSQQNHDPSP